MSAIHFFVAMTVRSDERFIHAFNVIEGVGYTTLARIWHRFCDFEYAWNMACVKDFLQAGLTEEMALRIDMARRKVNVETEHAKLWERDIFLIGKTSKEFPDVLREIPNPPFLLYRKGAALRQEIAHIAVVGTRVPSMYGEKMALEIGENITLSGGIVVSGLAFGIDAIAHHSAIKNGRPTVAVLASGLQRITPGSHTSLASRILEKGGTLVSEYASSVSYKDNFLQRNRIISGLSKATIVIEARRQSGALITAHHALEQGRDIYALVGDLTRPQAQGCLQLIADGGAAPIVSVHQLLTDMGFSPDRQMVMTLGDGAQKILELLGRKGASTDVLVEQTGFSAPVLNALLSRLELKNLIAKNQSGSWIKR